ncbi:MAG TPA: hypothetical protein VLC92_20425 [Rhodocyclaceae bacterium]|nr:hypothetical protein [Rhodocyclaceae bacterium]
MSPQLYAVLEPLIVGLIVLLAAIAVLRKQAPTLWMRITGMRAGTSCHDSGDAGKSGSCGSGCGNCGQASAPATQQTVHLHPRQP